MISTSNNDIDFIGLSTITDPATSIGHIIRVVAREQGVGVNNPFLLVDLNQGGGAAIATLNITQGTLTTTFLEYNYTLTNAEADAITDYADLEFRFEASCNPGTCSAGAARDIVEVSFAEFVILDNPPVPPPTLNSVSVLNSTALQVIFSEPADTSQVLSYNIERNDGSGFIIVGNIPQGTTIFDDVNLIADTFYSYRIISVGASSNSIASNVIGQRTTIILFSATPDSNPGVRWVNGLGNPPCSDLATFECVSDIPERDDGDFIQSLGLGSGGTDLDIMTLSDIEDPLISNSHFLKYTLREAGVGTNPIGFEIVLKQGVTTIATFTHPQGSIQSGNFQIFQQELNQTSTDQISDYSDLSVELTAFCTVGCSNNPSAREKLNVSFIVFEIEQVSAPTITVIDTLSSSSLRVNWTNEDLDAEITDVIIQRENQTEFIIVGNVTTSVFSFDDTGLPSSSIIKYRLTGMLPSGFATPSIEFSGATPPSSAVLNTNGSLIEPNANNSFTKEQREIFSQTIEHFNVESSIILLIITDIETNQLNAYETIDKMNNGSYGVSQSLSNAGAYYGTRYLEVDNISQFLLIITDEIRESLAGSNGTGNDPTHGDEPPAT